jgi:5-(carboxyamino)imidazole ribonucleotide mutase
MSENYRRIDLMKTITPLVSVVMGSKSDWETMKTTVETLQQLGIAVEYRVASAHRTPDIVSKYAREAVDRGVKVIIAAAGGAAHLAGVIAAYTWLPVLGVPIESKSLKGLDSLLSMVQMPPGIPVATLAIGTPGAKNAALFAAAILAVEDKKVRKALLAFREKQTAEVAAVTLP